MGDRSAIVIHSEQYKTPITFYGHWSGDDNVKAVENVLKRTDRIGDPTYLAGQLFYEFAINLGGYDGNLGFGIMPLLNNYDDEGDDNPSVWVDAESGNYRIGDGQMLDRYGNVIIEQHEEEEEE